MPQKTLSEQLVEEFCRRHHIECRRIKVAQTPENRRPDYAIRVGGGWCILEVKELAPTDEDEARLEELRNGIIKHYWVTSGKRLRGPIRSGEGQLRKFAARDLPTVICLVDTTVSFHDADFQIRSAMYGDETLHFAVSPTTGTGHFLGSEPGKNAMLRWDERTTVSAVAVFRLPAGSEMVVDLYHNRFAAIPIEPGIAAPFVRQQFGVGIDAPKKEGPAFDELNTHQSTPFNDQRGLYLIYAGSRGALRDSLANALLYAYEAALQGNNPTSIVDFGTRERLDASAILQGWRKLGLHLPVA